jgi:hypothetical protein
VLFALAGEQDRALSWLEQALTRGALDVDKVENDPLLAGLRSDPRFRAACQTARQRGTAAAPGTAANPGSAIPPRETAQP